jgi:hypothetical protein
MSVSNEIVLYQSDEAVRLEVLLEEETVWLTQAQMVELFGTSKQSVSLHINNIFKEGELSADVVVKDSLTTTQHGAIAGKTQRRPVKIYNLDVIISVGYRVKSQRGTQFRIWATGVLKEYLLRGYAVNQRVERLEQRMGNVEDKIDFIVNTALPPHEGVFYDGEIFDAYTFAADLIKRAKKRIVLLDNYVDETVLLLLSKRKAGVKAKIYTRKITRQLNLNLTQHNAQYAAIEIETSAVMHDRFLIIDNTVYHFGASFKDLGKKLFGFSKTDLKPAELLKHI